MKEVNIVIDSLIAQGPALAIMAAAAERSTELTVSALKELIGPTKFSLNTTKSFTAITSFAVGTLMCSYAGVTLMSGLVGETIGTAFAGAVVSLGAKYVHDATELLSAIVLNAKSVGSSRFKRNSF